MSFKEVNIKDLDENFVKLVADEWMQVGAISARCGVKILLLL